MRFYVAVLGYHPIFGMVKEQLYPELPKAIPVFADGCVYSRPKEEAAMDVPVLWLISKGGHEGSMGEGCRVGLTKQTHNLANTLKFTKAT